VSDLESTDVELRRAARERALQLLYEAEAKGIALDELVASLPIAPDALSAELVQGVDARRAEIDDLLTRRVAPRWTLTRLAAVDRAVLRLATYELLGAPDRSQALIINEAVVLARRFGTDDSPRFVNGVLAAIAAEVRPAEVQAPVAPKVDAVIVDLDGVIRHWDNDAWHASEEDLGLPRGTIAAQAFEPDRLDRAMRGVLSAEEWASETGAAVAADHDVDPAAVATVFAEAGWRIDEAVLEVLAAARRRVPVVLLCNASTRLLADLEVSGIVDRFDAIVGSAEIGVSKPAPDAFAAAAAAVGVTPERCVFVDDTVQNIAGAQAVGMRTVHFEDVATLESELAALGLA
jgi:putative hydrolase of the HAD superfamily